MKLRLETFVVEQNSVYNDLDEHDLEAIHIFHENEAGEVDAYARVFETGTTIHFGRVVSWSKLLWRLVLKNGLKKRST